MGWKHIGFSIKKKFQALKSVKKVMLIGPFMSISIDFFEKSSTVNSASYYQLLKQNSPYLLNDPNTDK